jgi:hypothetical protein
MVAGMADVTKKTSGAGFQSPTAMPRDLADFHLRWPEFRMLAAAVAARGELSGAEREVVRWLIQLADRIGPRDLL